MNSSKVIIIAEVGVNHNGKLSNAKKIIKNSKIAGADFVKLQLYSVEELLISSTPLADYQSQNKKKMSQFKLLKKYEIDEKFIKKIRNYCNLLKIKLLVTPFDLKSLKTLIRNKFTHIKISSSDLNNHQLLEHVSNHNLKVFLSTGMSNTNQINEAVKILSKNKIKKDDIILLQCSTEYPADIKDANLKAMVNFEKLFQTKFGYSDHTLGNTASIVAVSLGAKVIEKHVTLNKKAQGPDHKASMNKKEFIKFVKSIREAEIALGQEKKVLSKLEIKNSRVIRKSIVAIRDISKGELFNSKNISCKRPNLGISSERWREVIGKKSKYNFKKDDFIKI
jgi:N,N'-diacetyllegionaminate synthase